MGYKTAQEEFWAGEFGNKYIERNKGKEIFANKVNIFARIIKSTLGGDIDSCLELGCNIGLNLKALCMLIPNLKATGIEINKKAADECAKLQNVHVINDSIINFVGNEKYDLTFTSGVLIHINPEELENVYKTLYENSKKYILINEYYNPTPVSILYRGNADRLFKRDFAGEFMQKYPDVKLVDYGFFYHGDRLSKADDSTWFLMEKC